MIEHTAAPTADHRLYRHRCTQTGHPKVISDIKPPIGFTAYCQRCRRVENIPWSDLPTPTLQGMQEGISAVLVARAADGV